MSEALCELWACRWGQGVPAGAVDSALLLDGVATALGLVVGDHELRDPSAAVATAPGRTELPPTELGALQHSAEASHVIRPRSAVQQDAFQLRAGELVLVVGKDFGGNRNRGPPAPRAGGAGHGD